MKIGVIQAASQAGKNRLLYETVKEFARGHEVRNFGCFADGSEQYTYIEISVMVGMLLSSGSLDFVVTGCSLRNWIRS